MNKLWAIKNTVSGAYYRNALGNIPFFMSHTEAQDFIDKNLPQRLWDAVEYKR